MKREDRRNMFSRVQMKGRNNIQLSCFSDERMSEEEEEDDDEEGAGASGVEG